MCAISLALTFVATDMKPIAQSPTPTTPPAKYTRDGCDNIRIYILCHVCGAYTEVEPVFWEDGIKKIFQHLFVILHTILPWLMRDVSRIVLKNHLLLLKCEILINISLSAFLVYVRTLYIVYICRSLLGLYIFFNGFLFVFGLCVSACACTFPAHNFLISAYIYCTSSAISFWFGFAVFRINQNICRFF